MLYQKVQSRIERANLVATKWINWPENYKQHNVLSQVVIVKQVEEKEHQIFPNNKWIDRAENSEHLRDGITTAHSNGGHYIRHLDNQQSVGTYNTSPWQQHSTITVTTISAHYTIMHHCGSIYMHISNSKFILHSRTNVYNEDNKAACCISRAIGQQGPDQVW
jgi:hypothetical protein